MKQNYFIQLGCLFILSILIFTCSKEESEAVITIDDGILANYEFDGNTYNSIHGAGNSLDSLFFQGQFVENRVGTEESAVRVAFNTVPPILVEREKFIMSEDFSISIWAFADLGHNGNWRSLVSKWDSSGEEGDARGYYLGISKEDTLRWRYNDHILDLSSSFPMETWTHVVATFSPDKLQVYINGILEGELDITFDQKLDYEALLCVGGQYFTTLGYTSGYLMGNLDDFRIYDRVLGKEEVIALLKM